MLTTPNATTTIITTSATTITTITATNIAAISDNTHLLIYLLHWFHLVCIIRGSSRRKNSFNNPRPPYSYVRKNVLILTLLYNVPMFLNNKVKAYIWG